MEQTNTQVSAAAAAAIASAAPATGEVKPKRQVSPQAQAALELHRQRANLGLGLLAILEAGASGDLATLKPKAEAWLVEEAARKAAAEAERRANTPDRGTALAAYREKTADAMALAEYLKSTGVNVEELLAKAKAAANQAPDAAAQ